MKYLKDITMLVLAGVLFSSVAAADDTLTVLDKALEFVTSYDYGKNIGYGAPVDASQVDMLMIDGRAQPGHNPLLDLESIVFHLSPDSELRGEVEDKLIVALKAAKTDTAKHVLCRHLQVIGTAKCVPALESLLSDAKVAHTARYALGRMECSEAADALYRGLSKVSGNIQAGIINDLANRRYTKAKTDIIKLLNSDNTTVAKAAARALGRLGGNDAVKALKAARKNACEVVGNEIDNALLNCAVAFMADGENVDAEVIYEDFYSNSSEKQFKLAGLRGLLMVRHDDAASLLVDTIKRGDASMRRDAIGFITLVQGKKATRAFTSMLKSLPDELKSLAILGLGARGESETAKALVAYTKSKSQAVRMATLESLGKVGDVSTVTTLIEAAAAADDDMEKAIARASLVMLEGKDVDAKLNKMVNTGDTKARIEVLNALAARRAESAFDNVMRAAKDSDKDVRAEAITTLGFVATGNKLDSVIKLALDSKAASDLQYFDKAVVRIFSKIENPDDRATPILAEMNRVTPELKVLLLKLLSKSGSGKALETVIDSTKSDNDKVAVAAVRALSGWPDTAAADELLNIAENSDKRLHKVLALRGYVHLAELSDNAFAMYTRAMKLAGGPADKKMVLSGLADSNANGALEMALQSLDDEQIQSEAGIAATQIADRLRHKDADKARNALARIVKTVGNESVRDQAQEILNDMDKNEDHITKYWVVAGPFLEDGLEGGEIYKKVFPLENDFNTADWKPLTKGIGGWGGIDLEAQFGDLDHVAAYVRTTVISDVDQPVQVESGADDMVMIWVNGELLYDRGGGGGISPRKVLVKANLKKGENTLVIKVVDHAGGWGFCSRIRKANGTKLDGLEFQAR